MKVLTVQQPWAWAIFHGKDVENRTQLWKYRGPLAIHAGARVSERGMRSELVRDAWDQHGHGDPLEALAIGAVLGVVDVVDAHPATRAPGTAYWCCAPWGEHTYDDKGGIVHLVLENPREFKTPIPNVKGKLGLWTPDAALLAAIESAA